MKFSVKIKNLGKLNDDEFHIGKFTVFAGPNNSGKSFVSKLLYSILSGMKANHAELYLTDLIEEANISQLARPFLFKSEHDFSFDIEIENLIDIVQRRPYRNLEELRKTVHDLVSELDKILGTHAISEDPDVKSKSTTIKSPRDDLRLRKIDLSIRQLSSLKDTLDELEPEKIIANGMRNELKRQLIHNFQVSNLSQLQNEVNSPIEIEIQNFGRFEFSNKDIFIDIDNSSIDEWQHYSTLAYIESPIYWKLKKALESIGKYRYRSSRSRLSGIPEYFYDLAYSLNDELIGEIAFPELYENLTSDKFIGGKITISKTGDLFFQENDRNFSLTTTANGVANLGFLALLIERNVLDKNSFLFMDEPEAHLHPAWQVVIAESLFELSKQGVHVVIATHSVDILKWLEVHVKKNPDHESLIALNQFPANDNNTEDFDEKLADIKQELTKPFADLYLQGI